MLKSVQDGEVELRYPTHAQTCAFSKLKNSPKGKK